MLFSSDEEDEVYRYFCDCGEHENLFEINVIKVDDRVAAVSLCTYPGAYTGGHSFWRRLKQAFWHLLGRNSQPWFDFMIRKEDAPEIIRVLERLK